MKDRKDNLLIAIIEQYTKTCEPVGSKLIAGDSNFNVSSATIRNVMAELEKDGLITQPHTSAGRIPTEQGYQYYVDNFLAPKNIRPSGQKIIQNFLAAKSREAIKNLAKILAEVSNLGVLIAFSKNDVYYTGLSNLFSQPEFYNHKFAHSMSAIIDRLDEAVGKIFYDIKDEVRVLVGSNSPFGKDSGAVLTKHQKKLIGILGPIRMDYRANFSLLNEIKKYDR